MGMLPVRACQVGFGLDEGIFYSGNVRTRYSPLATRLAFASCVSCQWFPATYLTLPNKTGNTSLAFWKLNEIDIDCVLQVAFLTIDFFFIWVCAFLRVGTPLLRFCKETQGTTEASCFLGVKEVIKPTKLPLQPEASFMGLST